MYPSHPGGWKRSLESAVRHHNYSHCSTIGCTPVFALKKEVAYLPADDKLGIKSLLKLEKRRKSPEEEQVSRTRQKQNFDKRFSCKIPHFEVGDEVLVKVGNTLKYSGPYSVTDVQRIDGVPKRISHVGERNDVKTSALRNVLKFSPRRDNFFDGESSSTLRSETIIAEQ